jgi:RHH-type rel operon transcriptional repressor/antitoxin RelB
VRKGKISREGAKPRREKLDVISEIPLAKVSYVSYIIAMLSVRLSKNMEDRLTRVARQAKRPKSYFVRKAIEEKIEDMEDLAMAIKHLEHPGKTITLQELAKELNVDLDSNI